MTLNANKETQNWDTYRTANSNPYVPICWGWDKQRGEESRGQRLLVSEKEGEKSREKEGNHKSPSLELVDKPEL